MFTVLDRRSKFKTLPETQVTTISNHQCRHCQKIVIDTRSSFWVQILPYTVDEALVAAADGCRWYGWLLSQIKLSGKPTASLDRDQFFLYFEYKDEKVKGEAMWDLLSITVWLGTTAYRWPCATFHVFAREGDVASQHVSTRPFNTNVSSDASFNAIRGWIRTCMGEHRKCSWEAEEVANTSPKRLIDVGVSGDNVTLVEATPTASRRRKYLALSYCWGGKQSCKTKKTTLTKHMQKISIRSLPKSIQDAVRIVRRLGFRFLWVDSLCIVQDDAVEMEEEVLKMPGIYEEAFLVISAASAKKCTKGFLHTRPDATYNSGPFKLHYRCADNSLGTVNLFQQEKMPSKDEIINTRGWTLQESFMATRLLTYGNHSVRWSCLEAEFTDGGTPGLSYDISFRKNWSIWKEQMERGNPHRNPVATPIGELLVAWKQIVEEFSSRTFTFPRDRLPALSGIAHRFFDAFHHRNSRSSSGIEYRDGLWTNDIHRQLLWTPIQEKKRRTIYTPGSRKPADRRHGPSWSWASVDCAVSFPDWEHIPVNYSSSDESSNNSPKMEIGHATYKSEHWIEEDLNGIPQKQRLVIEGSIRDHGIDLDQIELILDTDEDVDKIHEQAKWGGIMLLQITRSEKFKLNSQIRPRGLVLREDKATTFCKRIGIFRAQNATAEEGYFDNEHPRAVTII